MPRKKHPLLNTKVSFYKLNVAVAVIIPVQVNKEAE